MYKQCKTEQSSRRQRQLELGLLEAMKYQRFEEISVSGLCDSMQIPRKAFYRYFEGKEGALYALIDHVLQNHDLYITPRLAENSSPQDYMEQIFHYWLNQRDLLDVLEKNCLESILIQRAIVRASEEFPYPVGGLKRKLMGDQKHRCVFIVCGLMSLIVQWHHEGYAESARNMAKTALSLMTEPLLTI